MYQSAVDAFPDTTKRQHSTQPLRVVDLHWTPYAGMNTLFIRGLVQNENKEYNPIILFKGVNYNVNPQDGTTIKIQASNGVPHILKQLTYEDHDVVVRCNCKDYYYRFNYYNHLDGSQYGRKRAKYESKGIRPPRS